MPKTAEILEIPLAVSDYVEVMDWMDALIAGDGRGYLTAAAVNLVMSAHEDPAVHAAVLGATLAVPDGQPLVWALHALGHARATRVYGPELMALYCARAAAAGAGGTPIYLYGGRDQSALTLLERRLRERFPGLRIVGGHSPPFRTLTAAEEDQVIAEIDGSGRRGCLGRYWTTQAGAVDGAHATPPVRAAARRRRRGLRLPRRPRPAGPAVDAAQWS